MATININIRTDSELKARAQHIFSTFGLDMTTAVNLFLRQTVRMNNLPFSLTTKTNQSNHVDKLPFGRGCMKGKIQMAEDFDAPLEDFKEYMDLPYCLFKNHI
ncbi:MAG: type II toxin-antitoxin system RelB/DinJ family antitoxin [Clostridiales Family XIII bacterium]|jgi:DNA-damage-inducible protein J|nr:type II toxin-antitoxin system RelB/DinJ family antitoxin [Clostridiales Family XIII bacterium]